MGDARRGRGLLVVAALAASVISPAGAAQHQKAAEPRFKLAADGRSYVGTLGGQRVLIDTVLGSVTPLGRDARAKAQTSLDLTAGSRARASASGSAEAGPRAEAEPAAEGSSVHGWDPRLAGMRRSPFYPAVKASSGPGAITTILGGMCDGLPGPLAAVVPGTLKTDKAGRIFWIDHGWNGHTIPLPSIRMLDGHGRIHTLGTIGGPLEGRVFRDGATNAEARITPDERGGVYYTYLAWITGTSFRSGWEWSQDDLPQATVIGHLSADGSHEFVSGVRVNTGAGLLSPWAYRRGDGGSYQDAGWVFINSLTADPAGNLYVADGEPAFVSGSLISSSSYSPDPSGTSTKENPITPGAHEDNTGGLIRFLNRSSRAVTFYEGTSGETTVPAGKVQTIAGSLTKKTNRRPEAGSPVPARDADIRFVAGIDVDRRGNLLLLEVGEGLVRVLGINTGSAPATMLGVRAEPGNVTVLGGGQSGYAGDGGPASKASFDVRSVSSWFYGDLAATRTGGVLVADTVNNRIRAITASGRVSTLAGTGADGFNGDGNTGTATSLRFPMGVDEMPSGEPVFSDWANVRIRTLHRGVVRTLGGNGSAAGCADGYAAGSSAGFSAPYGPARNTAYARGAEIARPHDAATDSRGNTYVADPMAGVVWRIDPAGNVTAAVGTPARCTVDVPYARYPAPCIRAAGSETGSLKTARLRAPAFLLVDGYDNLYVADGARVLYANLSAKAQTAHGINVLPGRIELVLDRSRSDRIKRRAAFGLDTVLGGMALDDKGTLYVGNITGNQILALNACRIVSVVAGTGAPSLRNTDNGDDGPARAALVTPRGLAFDPKRNLLLIADFEFDESDFGGRVRAVNVGTKPVDVWGARLAPGFITTYLGRGQDTPGSSRGDGGHARDATLIFPYGVDVVPGGRVFVSDAIANVVRVVETDGTVGTIAGMTPPIDTASNGSIGFMTEGGECGDGGQAAEACLQRPVTARLTPDGDLLVADYESGRLRKVKDAPHAPLRRYAPQLAGSGWRFTPALRLLEPQSLDALDPSLTFDRNGDLLVLATLRQPDAAVGCGLWRYDIARRAGERDNARYLGSPDGLVKQPIASGAGVSPVGRLDLIGKGACSIAAPAGGGRIAELRGSNRIVYASGTRAFSSVGGSDGDDGNSVLLRNVVTGASTDGEAFASSFFGAVSRALIIKNPFLAAAESDSYMSFDYTDRTGADTVVSSEGIGIARSVDGTEYVHLADVWQAQYPFSHAPILHQLYHSEPVVRGDDIAIPYQIELCTTANLNKCTFQPDWDTRQFVAVSHDSGATWTRSDPLFSEPCYRDAAPGWLPDAYCEGYHGLPQLAQDRAGTMYMTWDDQRHVYLSSSPDGLHWSSPVRVDRGLSLAGYPTLVAGDDGRVAVAYYGTTAPARDLASSWAQWSVYLSSTQNAHASKPAFAQSVASDGPVHFGELCQEGVACWWYGSNHIPGTPVGSYFRAAIDPVDGRVIIAYAEDASVTSDVRTPGITVTRQCNGPRLLAGRTATRPCASAAQRRPRQTPEPLLIGALVGNVPPTTGALSLSPCAVIPGPPRPPAAEPAPAPAPAAPVPNPPLVQVAQAPPPIRPPVQAAPIPAPAPGVQGSFSEAQAAQGQAGGAFERQEQAQTALARAADAVREQEELAMIRRRGTAAGPWYAAAVIMSAAAMFGFALRTRTRTRPAAASGRGSADRMEHLRPWER